MSDSTLTSRYAQVRELTETLAEPLSAEDQTVQSMADASPTKWHRAHTSWFFETFVLSGAGRSYKPFHPDFAYLFNSYYEALGSRHPRPQRGLLSRPGREEVASYRCYVDDAMLELLSGEFDEEIAAAVELGLNHEQQHQELLLMDAKHLLSLNPLVPTYIPRGEVQTTETTELGFIAHEGGLCAVGHGGEGFAFDNEGPEHALYLEPFALGDRPVSCGEWLAFIDDGGYERAELWLSEGWASVVADRQCAPFYWFNDGRERFVFTLHGAKPLDMAEPVCHVNYFEADAYARWSGARLPTEAEWETIARSASTDGHFLDLRALHPRATTDESRPKALFGDVWEWTSSAYLPYPGFRPAPGAVGEYNGKFMVNQHVLRGGCSVTPLGHVRATYRNFFPPKAQWAFSGLRLAKDL